MKNANDFINEMESKNILTNRKCSFEEYTNELAEFQKMICKMIAKDKYHENMRIDEATFILESIAREKGVRSYPAVNIGIQTMRKLTKELAITMSGINGERIVSKTLEYLNRHNTQIFHNVYITDGTSKTESDVIVLTDNGIIILEVKKVKSDVTFTEEGRMILAGDECYDKVPLAEKMAFKRQMLKKYLENAVAEKGLNIPIHVDSFIVLSAPKGQYIKIDDRYRREKHCFRTGVNKKIENYLGCAYYKEEDLKSLGEILTQLESNFKVFETQLNYDEVRRNLAEAFAILLNDCEERTESSAKTHSDDNVSFDSKKNTPKQIKSKEPVKSNIKSTLGWIASALAIGLVVTGVTTAVILETP